MPFFGVNVRSGKQLTQKLEYHLFLSNVALSMNAKPGKKQTLMLKVEGEEYVICTLEAGRVDQYPLQLEFSPGDQVTLANLSNDGGEASLFVTGACEIPYTSDDDSDEFSMGSSDREDEEDYLKGSPPEDEEDDEDSDFVDDDDDDDDDESVSSDEDSESEEEPAPSSSKKQRKGVSAASSSSSSSSPSPSKHQSTPTLEKTQKIKRHPTGLQYEVLKPSTRGGKSAQNGLNVSVAYVGKLQNGKVFDQSKNFSFRLGAGEVIRGWDIGVAGMKVGETRRLTVPASLGYGNEGIRERGRWVIPRGATLIFDVTLNKC